ncbi:ABC transporter ATP-binding protein [Falsigemmobacter faecalis]|uniref:ABC transporter ATP-binding protein n=1 Tax=Falsigemmobacter faecalis TaxID=2488730 RepID=A0A3P3DPY5_9RHOB|nr:ABC transporter ATP-binding protein [Falsigemmobacter faecalis]RRH76221.1 ABC transporter ATP-binding protein [Falsigemmobacter faecalis]
MTPVLQVEGLRTEFRGPKRNWFPVVNEVDLTLQAGETLAVVGESGCGKSMLAHSMLQLLPPRIARISAGSIRLGGQDLLTLSEPQMRRVRGKEISMVFQEPMTSLNPLMKVGRQIEESVRVHEGCSEAEARARAIELMEMVGIPEARIRADQFPFQLSGGMRQRIVIAIALACRPKVLIADEPTTALDVTIQAQVLELIDRLKTEIGMGVILITHDLGVVAEWSQRVMVMYAGRKVEEADTETFFSGPRHPYAQALLASVPRPDAVLLDGTPEPLSEISGTVPPMDQLGPGCAFAPRCPQATGHCHSSRPPLTGTAPGPRVACFHAGVLR